MTNTDRILEFIRQFPGRDDDEIAAALKLSQRQTVNQAARELERLGKVKRAPGPRGKIANYPRGPQEIAVLKTRPASSPTPKPTVEIQARSALPAQRLIEGGFSVCSRWLQATDGDLVLETALPKHPGVYAFSDSGTVLYIGVATIDLAKRLYFYRKPGPLQTTNFRVKALLLQQLKSSTAVDILVATPSASQWNGLPVNTIVGLEIGLIETFGPPWNLRSVTA